MDKIPFNTIVIGLMLLLAQFGACSAPVHNVPAWTTNVMTEVHGHHEIVGVSFPMADERTARDDAMLAALKSALQYAGMELVQYAEMVSREKGALGNTITSVDNKDVTQIATDGFIQKAKVVNWHIEQDTNGMYVAYAKVSVPSDEIKKMEAFQQIRAKQRQGPLRAANAALDKAEAEHDLHGAVQAISGVIEAHSAAHMAGINTAIPDRRLIFRKVFSGISFTSEQGDDSIYYDLDTSNKIATVFVFHRGAPVQGLRCTMTLPSGKTVETLSQEDGRLDFQIPSPAHAGAYEINIRPDVDADLPATEFAKDLRLIVEGDKDLLARGNFHDFVEARGTGSVPVGKYNDRNQAEFMAVKTARHLAYANLLEARNGIQIESSASYRNQGITNDQVYSRAQGHINAKEISTKVTWQEGRPIATVVLRTSL